MKELPDPVEVLRELGYRDVAIAAALGALAAGERVDVAVDVLERAHAQTSPALFEDLLLAAQQAREPVPVKVKEEVENVEGR